MDSYDVRRTLFEKPSVFTLENGALVRSIDGRAKQSLALSDVRRVNLSYQPLTMVERWVCSVGGRGGRIWLPSASFTGIGRAEDRRTTFRPFVEALNAQIAGAPAASTIAFVQGSNWSAWLSLIVLIALALVSVLLMLVVIGELVSGSPVSGMGGIVIGTVFTSGSAGILWRIWRRNQQHRYDPAALPPDFAPLG